jgi:hypothetical protein
VITEFPASSGGVPFGITAGPDGNLWFTESLANILGRMTPTGAVTLFTVPGSLEGLITAGPDGNLWFPLRSDIMAEPEIGRITPTGAVTAFPLPAMAGLGGMTGAPDGNVWFTVAFRDNTAAVGPITPAGEITLYPAPRSRTAQGLASFPVAITAGPDGNLWYVDQTGNEVVKVVPQSAAPLTPNQQFLTHLYGDLLGRPPDAAGLVFWDSQLSAGLTRFQVILGFEQSPEYRAVLVEQLYAKLFHRQADSSGLNTWTTFLANGGTAAQLETTLLGSAEYFALHGSSNSGFLQGIYQDVLGRALDPSGAASWGGLLASGAPRQGIALAVVQSLEGAQAAVQFIYSEFLHRPADPSGLQTWTNALQGGLDFEKIQAAVASGDEYFNRV